MADAKNEKVADDVNPNIKVIKEVLRAELDAVFAERYEEQEFDGLHDAAEQL